MLLRRRLSKYDTSFDVHLLHMSRENFAGGLFEVGQGVIRGNTVLLMVCRECSMNSTVRGFVYDTALRRHKKNALAG